MPINDGGSGVAWGVYITGPAYPKGAWLESGSGRWATTRGEAEDEVIRRRVLHASDNLQFEARPHAPQRERLDGIARVVDNFVNKADCHYSGINSAEFWGRVGYLADEADHASMYALGCVLQNLESYVLQQLAHAEQRSGKKEPT